MKIRYVELLVGRMQVVVGKAEAHHHGRNFQHVLEVRHDWNGAARADEYCFLLEGVVQRLGGGFDEAIFGSDDRSGTFAPNFDLDVDALRRE